LSVSVDHASAWVALKGPWRHACGRVSGRKGDGQSGCVPDASIQKRRGQDSNRAGGRPQPSTPKNLWEAGKGPQGRPVGDDADTGTRSGGVDFRPGGRFGARVLVALRIAVLSAAFVFVKAGHLEMDVEYVKSIQADAGPVSVDHASAWVALKGPWRLARGRVSGR
jgi:hypothetical protein